MAMGSVIWRQSRDWCLLQYWAVDYCWVFLDRVFCCRSVELVDGTVQGARIGGNMTTRESIDITHRNLWDKITDLFDINEDLLNTINEMAQEIERLEREIAGLEEEIGEVV